MSRSGIAASWRVVNRDTTARYRSKREGQDAHGALAQGTFRKDRHAALLNETERPEDISPAQWRYLRIELLGPEDAAKGDFYSYRCDDCLVHGPECEEMFATETEAKIGCNPLDFPAPVFA